MAVAIIASTQKAWGTKIPELIITSKICQMHGTRFTREVASKVKQKSGKHLYEILDDDSDGDEIDILANAFGLPNRALVGKTSQERHAVQQGNSLDEPNHEMYGLRGNAGPNKAYGKVVEDEYDEKAPLAKRFTYAVDEDPRDSALDDPYEPKIPEPPKKENEPQSDDNWSTAMLWLGAIVLILGPICWFAFVKKRRPVRSTGLDKDLDSCPMCDGPIRPEDENCKKCGISL